MLTLDQSETESEQLPDEQEEGGSKSKSSKGSRKKGKESSSCQ